MVGLDQPQKDGIMAGEAPLIYKSTNGDKMTVASGGVVDFESGGALKIAGTDATAALSIAAFGSSRGEVVTATNVITAAESGKTFFLNSATEFVSTLPAPALGLRFTFVVAAAPSGASYTVICAASGTLIKGHVLTNDVNSATDADFGTAGELTLTFVDSKAVAGDRADFECDGTNWFVRASCSVFDAITIS